MTFHVRASPKPLIPGSPHSQPPKKFNTVILNFGHQGTFLNWEPRPCWSGTNVVSENVICRAVYKLRQRQPPAPPQACPPRGQRKYKMGYIPVQRPSYRILTGSRNEYYLSSFSLPRFSLFVASRKGHLLHRLPIWLASAKLKSLPLSRRSNLTVTWTSNIIQACTCGSAIPHISARTS